MRVQSPASAELRTRPDPDPGLNRARRGRKARQIVQIFRAPARPTARHSRAPARPMPSYPKVTATATDAAALTGPHPPGRGGPGKVRLDERLQPLHGDRGGPGAQRALHQPEVDGADDLGPGLGELQEGAVPQPDFGVGAASLGSEAELVQQPDQPIDRPCGLWCAGSVVGGSVGGGRRQRAARVRRPGTRIRIRGHACDKDLRQQPVAPLAGRVHAPHRAEQQRRTTGALPVGCDLFDPTLPGQGLR